MIKNKISLIALLLFCSTFVLLAQVDKKYLAGAVPLVDGKVTFAREVKVSPQVSITELLDLATKWVETDLVGKRHEGSNQRILLTNKEENYIVVQGDEKLVFKSQFLMLDQTTITYHLVIRAEKGRCILEVRNIKYDYQDYQKLMSAEEMITDEIAMQKNGEKLNRHYNKFRTFTIDRVDELRNSLLAYLGTISVEAVKTKAEDAPISIVDVQETLPQPAPAIIVEKAVSVKQLVPAAAVTVAASSMTGYKQMDAEDISDNIMSMFKDNWALVVAGHGSNAKATTAAWSGIGNFGGKPVAMTIVDSKNSEEEVYTISFYTQIHKDALDNIEKGKENKLTPITTPSGATAYAEAWMIIECKKVLEQPATDSMIKDAQSKEWTNKNFDKLYMGEIVNVWAR